MRELTDLGIVLILESDGFGERGDRVLLTRKEMPAVGRTRTVVTLDVHFLLCRGLLWRVARIETNREYVEVFAQVEFQNAQRTAQPIQDLPAQHRALVINHVEDD